MATSTSSYEQLEDGIKHFLARHKDHPEVLANLARLLDSQPNILKVEALTPYDECKARLDLADDFQRRRRQECPEWQFTATKFSAFLLAPEYELKGRIIDGDDAKPLDQLLDSLGSATRYFLLSEKRDHRANAKAVLLTTVDAQDNPQHGPVTPSKRTHSLENYELLSPKRPKTESSLGSPRAPLSPSGRKSRNKAESEKCKTRDSFLCTVTGGDGPEACHIIPFTWNETEAHRRLTLSYVNDLTQMFEITSRFSDPLYRELGGSDKAWNMTCLSPQLHGYWGKAYFGLRRLGQLPEFRDKTITEKLMSVHLQFVWLPRRSSAKDSRGKALSHADDLVDLSKERQLLEASDEATPEDKSSSIVLSATTTGTHIPVGKRAFHVETTAQIYSGQVFEVRVPEKQVREFDTMIDLQWALIRMAAISGAADAMENGWDDSQGPGDLPLFLGDESDEYEYVDY